MTILFILTLIGLVATLGTFGRRVAALNDENAEALTEAVIARAELADDKRQAACAAEFYETALNTLRGRVAAAEDERDEARRAMVAVMLHHDRRRGDQLAERRSVRKRRATKRAASS